MTTLSGPSTSDSIFTALNTAHGLIDNAVLKLEETQKKELSDAEYEVYMDKINMIVRDVFKQIDRLYKDGNTGEKILALANHSVTLLTESSEDFLKNKDVYLVKKNT